MTPRPTRAAGIRLPRTATSVLAGLTLGLIGLALTGCTAAVPLEPATDAISPICADVVVHLPPVVAGQQERETDAQGTGAWGTPASVLLHCGVDEPGPTTFPCIDINGIDWVNDDSDAPQYRFTTYGRTPAVEVVVDSAKVSGSTVLADLTTAVALVPVTGTACTGVDDLNLPDQVGPGPVTLTPTSAPTTAP